MQKGDLEDLLRAAAAEPSSRPPLGEVWRAGRRRLWRDRVAVAVAALAVGGLIWNISLRDAADKAAQPATMMGEEPEVCDRDPHGCVEVRQGESVVFGTLLSISGEYADLGLDSQHGATLAAELRGGEVVGHTIEWNHQDDQCSPEGGHLGARDLALADRVTAVIGTGCAAAAQGVADQILGERGIVLISPSATSPGLTDPTLHQPFFLRVAHNDQIQARAMADFAVDELAATSAATITDGSPSGEALTRVFSQEFRAAGGEITARKRVQVGDEDMLPVLASIATIPPDLIYYPVLVDEGALITSQAHEVDGLSNVVLAGSDGMLSRDWVEATGPKGAEGVYLSAPDLRITSDVYRETVLPEYQRRWGEPTSPFHAHAFDATNLVLDAIEEVALSDESNGTTYIPRTAVRDELFETSDYRGAVGALTCSNDGDCNPGPPVLIKVVRDGDFVTVDSIPAR
jgi:branched-chain amino acid transport system substrate-binding protein